MTQSCGIDTTKTPYFAAIDLGSRNCRLLISKKTPNGVENLEATSRFVCLGENVHKTHKLSFEAMERAFNTLDFFQKKISQYPLVTLLAVTTAATRNAQNSATFLERIKEELNLELQVISSKQEAVFATLGCAELVDPRHNRALIFDIGGGSTELIFADVTDHKCPRLIDSISIPLGVVSLAEDLEHTTFKNYSQTVATVLEHTAPFAAKNNIADLIATDRIQLIGTSGTITTVSALHQNLRFYDRNKVDGSLLAFDDIEKTIKHVQLMSTEERLLHPCIGQSRDDLILGGLAIFEGIYKAFPGLSVTVTDRGVRDGIIYALAYPERLHQKHKATP